MKRVLTLALGMAATTVLYAQGGPKGYYMTAGNQMTNVRYDAGVLTTWSTSGGQDYPIAVFGDVRTAASGQFDPDHGGQYTLAGVWTGVDYKDFAFNNFDNLYYDGTTDGTHNYVMNYGNLAGVWQTDRDWSNSKLLFPLGVFGERLGITYDVNNKSLWVSHWDNGMVEEFDLAGNMLRSWDTGLGGSITCLAMDYSTNTLWMGRQSSQGTFYNYDLNGNRIGTFSDATLQGLNTLGGEFEVVPEPATLAALAAALLALRRRRR